MAQTRYKDWIFSTPLMLVSTMLYFYYEQRSLRKRSSAMDAPAPSMVKESRTGVNMQRHRFVSVPSRFGLREGTQEEIKEATEREADVGETLRLRLLGVGPRLYPIVGGLIKVSVYALGLYAEEKEAAARLQVLEPGLSASLGSHKAGHRPPPEYYEALLAPVQWPRALYLHFTRNVALSRVLDAFARYPKLTGPIMDGFKADFDRHFGAGGLKAGDVIGFVWVAEGLLSEINGQVVSFTPGADLAREVFRVYLGDSPVSQEAKIRLASEVPALLKEQRHGGV